jgi:predicted alpha/beta superfamily hydrolase
VKREWSLAVLMATLALATLSCARGVTGPRDNTWRFLPGHVEGLTLPTFRDGRPCWVYLPPGYAQSGARYPVLYMNDGQYAFDGDGCMHANRVAEDLIRRGEIEPLIIVAIACGPTDQRWLDYTPWYYPFPPYPQGGGEFYVRAVSDTLKPEVDRRYRTLPDRANTAMAGASLGGLISAYAFFVHDSTFGRAAAFSPSYWAGSPQADIYTVARHPDPPVRFYEDTGTVHDNYIVEMEQLLPQLGFVLGQDFMSATVTGGDHSSASWEHRMPDMLRFLFPPRRLPA